MERIDEIVDRLAIGVKNLTTEQENKIEYVRERHRLLAELEKLEPMSEEPMKKLRDRVELLHAIASYNMPFGSEPFDSFGPIKKLETRIELLQTIRNLEPNGPEPIKSLRQRLRTLKSIRSLESRDTEPMSESCKADRALTEDSEPMPEICDEDEALEEV